MSKTPLQTNREARPKNTAQKSNDGHSLLSPSLSHVRPARLCRESCHVHEGGKGGIADLRPGTYRYRETTAALTTNRQKKTTDQGLA